MALFCAAGSLLGSGCSARDRPGASSFAEGPEPPSASLEARPPAESTSTRPHLCSQTADPFMVVLEQSVAPGSRFRVLAVSESSLGGLSASTAKAGLSVLHRPLHSGPPFAVVYQGRAPRDPGPLPVRLVDRRGRQRACVTVTVSSMAPTPRPAPVTGVWRIRRGWHDGWERVFSAWIAHLFRPLAGQPSGWRPLHRVLRLPRRNLLHDRLGHREDDYTSRVKVQAWADCGDTPYQLRAYFAWKMGLPFRYRRCSRGNSIRGPRCPVRRDNTTAEFDRLANPVRRFNAFIRQGLAWWVHSGTLRTLPEDEGSDFYPIRLARGSIRPGTVFVDVSGHALVVTQWDHRGLFAIDGHPDMSVTRRRFSEKHFRYFRGTRTGGFKAFRPLKLVGGHVVPVPNSALRRFFSVEQYRFASRAEFYRRMRLLLATSAG